MTSAYLLHSFTFYQTFAFCASVLLALAVLKSLTTAWENDHLNKQEVRRLQYLIMQRLIVEPSAISTNLSDATNLMYTRMVSVEQYVSRVKYQAYENFAIIYFGLFLLLLLTWDMGLIIIVASTMVMTLTRVIYKKLSSPWEEHREQREAQVNAHILDLIVCKDVVRAHGQELKERERFERLLMNEEVRQETW